MYWKYYLLFFGINIVAVTSKHVKFYRKDYTYVFEYDAFYKLHVANSTSWRSAFLTCENEAAKLFYPSEEDEWRIVNKLREEMAESANVTDVLIGVHNQFNLGEFVTVDGHSPPVPMGDDLQRVEVGEICVTMDSDTNSYEKGPCTRQSPTLFVCKKLDTQPCPTATCPTIDPGYKYSSQSKKCYKYNNKAKPWQEAMQTCYMEGGQLAVAEDSESVNAIRSVLDLNQYTTLFIGVRDFFNNGQYYTVEGKNIGEISSRADEIPSYPSHNARRWMIARQQQLDPYNSKESGLEIDTETPPHNMYGCGVLTYEKIEAASCYNEKPFICEMAST